MLDRLFKFLAAQVGERGTGLQKKQKKNPPRQIPPSFWKSLLDLARAVQESLLRSNLRTRPILGRLTLARTNTGYNAPPQTGEKGNPV